MGVNPARAGMIRGPIGLTRPVNRKPRASGDDPVFMDFYSTVDR